MSYTDRFNVIAKGIEDNVDNLVKNVALAIGSNVIADTPILTGQARRNWQTELNQMPESVLDMPESPSEGMDEALQILQQTVGQYKAGDTVHITNNVPYIKELNSGSSQQAPANFVETSIMRATRLIRNVKVVPQ